MCVTLYVCDIVCVCVWRQAKQMTVTPMQWSKEANAGFTTGTPWLAVNPGYEARNLDVSLGVGGVFVLIPILPPTTNSPFLYLGGAVDFDSARLPSQFHSFVDSS